VNIRVRQALVGDGEVWEDVVVRIAGGEVASVERTGLARGAGERIDRDWGEVLLLPGLVNAHCHLDYTLLRGALLGAGSFTRWIQRLNAMRSVLRDEEVVGSVERGFQELTRHGITTVVNIGSYPEVVSRIKPPPVRTYWMQELMDVRGDGAVEERLELAKAMRGWDGEWRGGSGLSPHAPYTASMGLYRRAAAVGGLLTTHLGESAEEEAMFRLGTGPMYQFLKEIGRSMEDCGPGKASPLRRLAEAGIMDAGWLVAHLNEIAPEDWELVEPGGRLHRLGVVHCPQSHEFFGHRTFRMERLLGCGARVCLGTDSLASGRELSLFRELALAHLYHPRVPPQVLWRMVSSVPADLLGLGGKAGVLWPGAYADLTAIEHEGGRESIWDAVMRAHQRVHFTMCAGNIVFESHNKK